MKEVVEITIKNEEALEAISVDVEVDEEAYDKYLNGIYGEIEVCGLLYMAASVQKEIDPIAYKVGKANFEGDLDEKWGCPLCDAEYEEEDEARWCCQEEELVRYQVQESGTGREESELFENEDDAISAMETLNVD